ncbi:hypothetical protein GCM10022382_08970 [Microbacterium invictum]
MRLRGAEGVLAMTAAPIAPRGLLDSTPTVIGMRVLPVDPELVCDLIVDATALSRDDDALVLPDSGVSAPWAGIAPPRAGWEVTGELKASVLATRAQWGIAAVAGNVPRDAGDDAVHAVRASVWGVDDPELADLPRGVAFAAFGLGFIGGDETITVRQSGMWTRLTLVRGHILVRRQQLPGLTPVRRTGS